SIPRLSRMKYSTVIEGRVLLSTVAAAPARVPLSLFGATTATPKPMVRSPADWASVGPASSAAARAVAERREERVFMVGTFVACAGAALARPAVAHVDVDQESPGFVCGIP